MSVWGNTPEEVVDFFLMEKWGKDYRQHYISKVKKGDMLEKMVTNKSLKNKVNQLQSMDDAKYKALLKGVLGLN